MIVYVNHAQVRFDYISLNNSWNPLSWNLRATKNYQVTHFTGDYTKSNRILPNKLESLMLFFLIKVLGLLGGSTTVLASTKVNT